MVCTRATTPILILSNTKYNMQKPKGGPVEKSSTRKDEPQSKDLPWLGASSGIREGPMGRTTGSHSDTVVMRRSDAGQNPNCTEKIPLDSLENFAKTTFDGEGKVESLLIFKERIGGGGMGEVYEGVRIDGNNVEHRVAIKVYRINVDNEGGVESLRRDFLNEVHTLASLRDPKGRIVAIVDSGVLEDGRLYCAMEYLEGRNIENILREIGAYKWEEARGIILDVCEALIVAHEAGIVHRDLKPSNIILLHDIDGEERAVKVIDFGLARDMSRKRDTGEIGLARGTPAYMAPEQAKGEDVDSRTDIYGMGVLMYEMLSGRLPIEKGNENDIGFMVRVIREQHTPLSELSVRVKEGGQAVQRKLDIPAKVSDIVDKCLAKSADGRFQSMRELRMAIKDANGVSDSDTPYPSQRTSSGSGKSIKILIAGAAVAVVILAGGVAGFLGIANNDSRNRPAGAGGAEISAKLDDDIALPAVKPVPQHEKAPVAGQIAEPIQEDAGQEVQPRKTRHTLRINANVAGAGVFINGEKVGQTGADGSVELTLDDATEQVRITLRKRGYGSALVQITPDRDIERSVRMEEEREPVKAQPGKQSRFGFNPTKR